MISERPWHVKGQCLDTSAAVLLQLPIFRLTPGRAVANMSPPNQGMCDMAHIGFFDRTGDGLIHLLRTTCVLLFCLPLSVGCSKAPEGPLDAGTRPEPELDAGLTVAQDADPGIDGMVTAALDLRSTGIFQRGDRKVAQAVGKARKSVDMGLARSQAAARARGNLLALLKKEGLAPEDGHVLSGAAIEEVWVEGNILYALAVLTIENQAGELNESPPDASKSTGDAAPSTAGPQGGAGK